MQGRLTSIAFLAGFGVFAGFFSTPGQAQWPSTVGYLKTIVRPGFSLLGVHMSTENGFFRVGDVLKSAPDGTELLSLDPREGVLNWVDSGAWWESEMPLHPGKGYLLHNPSSTPFSVTLAVNFEHGYLQTFLPAGRSIIASPSPRTMKLAQEFGFPVLEGMGAWQVLPDGNLQRIAQVQDYQWVPVVPEVGPGTAVIIDSPVGALWIYPTLNDYDPNWDIESVRNARLDLIPSVLSTRPGQSLVLLASPLGFVPEEFYWFHEGERIRVSTNGLYSIASLTSKDFGAYHVVGRKAAGQYVLSISSSLQWITDDRLEQASLTLSRFQAGTKLQARCSPHCVQGVEVSDNFYDWRLIGGGTTDHTGTLSLPCPPPTSAVQYFRARTLSVLSPEAD